MSSPQQNKTLIESYKSLGPRGRLAFGAFLGATSLLGLWVSDQLEKKMPPPPPGSVADPRSAPEKPSPNS
ncbi:hypothetical protein AURDEDRAFT_114454 [Auricularia subglabra TFB-10046 SS5]|nr:hypothetical protein AURDEDRAFT_114454 [Auricularia subglabra TFB-10046 SS5]